MVISCPSHSDAIKNINIKTMLNKKLCIFRDYAPNLFISLPINTTIWYSCVGTAENTLNLLKKQQNKVIRICLNKKDLAGLSKLNYKELCVLPVNLLSNKFIVS